MTAMRIAAPATLTNTPEATATHGNTHCHASNDKSGAINIPGQHWRRPQLLQQRQLLHLQRSQLRAVTSRAAPSASAAITSMSAPAAIICGNACLHMQLRRLHYTYRRAINNDRDGNRSLHPLICQPLPLQSWSQHPHQCWLSWNHPQQHELQ
jgi:hypothetical protein